MAKPAFTPGSPKRTGAAAGPPRDRYIKSRGPIRLPGRRRGSAPPRRRARHREWLDAWEEWAAAPFFHRLSTFCQLVTFDQQGSGRSDPVESACPPTLEEERVDDLRSVIDAAGLERTALFGTHDGGAVSMLFAATYPERVSALVLANTWARLLEDDDFPVGFPRSSSRPARTGTRVRGAPARASTISRPRSGQPRGARRLGPPRAVLGQPGSGSGHLPDGHRGRRPEALPAISAPTLVMHAIEDLVTPIGHGRYLAEHIAGARLVEFASRDHLILIGEGNVILDEVEEFLTGVRRGPYRERMLATLVFTDVVGSTETADHLGDRAWRDLISRHHVVVRRELARFEGTEIDRAGDGFLAVFDGPGRAIQCALAILSAIEPLGLRLRVGVHTGESRGARRRDRGDGRAHRRAGGVARRTRRGPRLEHGEGTGSRVGHLLRRPGLAVPQGRARRMDPLRGGALLSAERSRRVGGLRRDDDLALPARAPASRHPARAAERRCGPVPEA